MKERIRHAFWSADEDILINVNDFVPKRLRVSYHEADEYVKHLI